MIAAIYSRKSRFTGKGESIENQIELAKNYGRNKGISEFLIYEDEGFSGGNIDRPEFKRLMADAKAKKFDMLICYRLDRISRNVSDFAHTYEILEKYNISFASVSEQFDTSTPLGKAMLYIASVFAQLERETIAERIKDNMMELAKTGRWLGGQCPLGFNSEKITYFDTEMNERSMFKLVPCDEELEKVKMLFNYYSEGGSLAYVLKNTLTLNVKGKNGGEMHVMSIRDILRNPVYVKSDKDVFEYLESKGMTVCGEPNGNGMLTYNKKSANSPERDTSEWIAAVGKHPGIIDSELWLEVNRSLDKNALKGNPRQGTSEKSLLSGILKCAKCDSPMRVSYGKVKKDGSDRIYYYSCTLKAHSAKSRCDNPNVRGDHLETMLAYHIKTYNTDILVNELKKQLQNLDISTKEDKLEEIKKDIELKNKQMSKLIDQLSTFNDTAADFISSKINTLGEEIKALKNKLLDSSTLLNEAEIEKINIDIVLENIKKFNEGFDDLKTNTEKRQLLESIVELITWNGETHEAEITIYGEPKKK